MCRGRVTGLGVDLPAADLFKSDLLLERGVLAVRPREALPTTSGDDCLDYMQTK